MGSVLTSTTTSIFTKPILGGRPSRTPSPRPPLRRRDRPKTRAPRKKDPLAAALRTKKERAIMGGKPQPNVRLLQCLTSVTCATNAWTNSVKVLMVWFLRLEICKQMRYVTHTKIQERMKFLRESIVTFLTHLLYSSHFALEMRGCLMKLFFSLDRCSEEDKAGACR
jgi:hypothetical protein